jgi:hypothetical protein
MRSTRVLLASLGAGALLAGLGGCGVASASTNGSGVWVQISPGTIQPGGNVKITANCGDNSNSATVTSIAFGTVTLLPQHTFMVGQVTVPPTAAAGTFAVDLTCKTGSTATTTLTVLGSNAVTPTAPPTMATMGPHTGGGFLANGGSGSGSGSSSGSRTPQVWIASGVVAIGAAAGIAALTKRRRRVPVRVRRR